jgi:hypothetical protein
MSELRKKTPQPTMRPVSLPKSNPRGGAYEKGVHDTSGKSWLHGGDPADKPGYVKGRAGQQQKLRRRWPY